MARKTTHTALLIPALALAALTVFATPADARGAKVHQANIGKRFAVQSKHSGNRHWTLVERKTGRTKALYGNHYDAKRVHAAVKGGKIGLSGWQIGKVEVSKLNQLGIRVGVHTRKHFGAIAFQLTDAKGWHRNGDSYQRIAKVNGRKTKLSFSLLEGTNKRRVGIVYTMGRPSLKERVAYGLRSLASKLTKSYEKRIVKKSRVVYSEAN